MSTRLALDRFLGGRGEPERSPVRSEPSIRIYSPTGSASAGGIVTLQPDVRVRGGVRCHSLRCAKNVSRTALQSEQESNFAVFQKEYFCCRKFDTLS